MPMDRGTPDLVRHCVAAVAKEYGGDTSKAFAICVAQLQKAGYLKPGTMELTAAGKKKEAEHEAEPDAAKKMKAYEKLLKANRKEESLYAEASEAEVAAKKMDKLTLKMLRGEIEAEEFGAMQDKIVKAAKAGGYEKEMYSLLDKKSQKEMGKAMKKNESFSYKQEAEWDASFYERLVRPTRQTGLEDVPRAVARRVETVTAGESNMDFIRRLAGVTGRYTDRALGEAEEADEAPEEYYFTNEDDGNFVLTKGKNQFVVRTSGPTTDRDMADLYTYGVRKAKSMQDAIKIIKKMVRY